MTVVKTDMGIWVTKHLQVLAFQEVRARKMIYHPKYNRSLVRYDIIIIELRNSFHLGYSLWPL